MIDTIIRNLLSNALKFTYEGGEIRLQVTKGAKRMVISIKDNGMGMSREELDKLFHIDKSVTRPGTADEKCTGLGLIICKEFVQKNGGEIGVESALEKGSRFYFTLPVAE